MVYAFFFIGDRGSAFEHLVKLDKEIQTNAPATESREKKIDGRTNSQVKVWSVQSLLLGISASKTTCLRRYPVELHIDCLF